MKVVFSIIDGAKKLFEFPSSSETQKPGVFEVSFKNHPDDWEDPDNVILDPPWIDAVPFQALSSWRWKVTYVPFKL